MFQIEKHVPLPPKKIQRRFPLDEMEVGDSFSAPKDALNSLRVTARQHGKRFNKKFVVRVVDKDSARCWRIE